MVSYCSRIGLAAPGRDLVFEIDPYLRPARFLVPDRRRQGQRTLGRLRVIDQLARKSGGFSLSVGSKSTRIADVNVDINSKVSPDIVATVFYLPLRSELFDTILFTDVVQYLPVHTETRALLELKRCSKKTGRIILSAPNAVAIFTVLDPDRWLFGNRPYSIERLSRIVSGAGLQIELVTALGGIWEAMGLLVYYFAGYLLRRVLHRDVPYPLKLAKMADAQYDHSSKGGYTIFIVCSQR